MRESDYAELGQGGEGEKGGSSLDDGKNSRSDICIFIISPAGRAGEGGEKSGEVGRIERSGD